jgi:4-diphosphocytidyl-2C-methyl-D-erythritol kinase
VHVSTADAYQQLGRPEENPRVTDALTSQVEFPILREFQTIAWALDHSDLRRIPFANDFEQPVFDTHREIPAVVRKLRRAGAEPVRMTGSGSAVFGMFESAEKATAAARTFPPGAAFVTRFLDRDQYRRLWIRALGPAALTSCFALPN